MGSLPCLPSPPPDLDDVKGRLGRHFQVTFQAITEIRITKDVQKLLALLLNANVAFIWLNVNNLAWATTGDTIIVQSQF